MYRLGFLVIILSSCHCEEDSLPVLLKFFHEKHKGDIGSLIDKYEHEAKGLMVQEKGAVDNQQEGDNSYKRSDQAYDKDDTNLNQDGPFYDSNAYNPYNDEIFNQNDNNNNGIYRETTYNFDETPQNTLVANTNTGYIGNADRNPAVKDIPYAEALGYEASSVTPMDVSRNRKRYNFFQSLFDILDNVRKDTIVEPGKVALNTDNKTVKKAYKPKNIVQPKKKTVSPKKEKQYKKDSKINKFVDTNIPVLNLNISLQDTNQKSIVLQIPINIYIGKNLHDDSVEEGLSIEAFVYPDAAKPILRSSDMLSGSQEAKDNAMAKNFRDLIKKSRLQSKANGELRRDLSVDQLIDPGINLNVK